MSNIESWIREFPEQSRKGLELGDIPMGSHTAPVFVCGMGGSAIAGRYLISLLQYLEFRFYPIWLVNSYLSDHFRVPPNAKAIFISYSGNTEETLHNYRIIASQLQPSNVIAITSGGRLRETAVANGNTLIELPKGYAPRHTLGYQLGVLWALFVKMGWLRSQRIGQLEHASERLETTIAELEQVAKQWSRETAGKLKWVYVPAELEPVAIRWKQQINENAKQFAGYHIIPEMSHNELEGFEGNIIPEAIFMLSYVSLNHRVRKRIKFLEQLIQEKGIAYFYHEIDTEDLLVATLELTVLGDWLSYFTALNTGVDPLPVSLIENLKKFLS
ncbi:MAG: hypothetical protein GXO48_08025 [Chlorobi bacterium]|nr:hypothetical protein [Chlorobiota bacterium]